MTAYQASFASHRTRDCHVGFLSPQCLVLETKQNDPELFYLVYIINTKLQLSDKNNAHALE